MPDAPAQPRLRIRRVRRAVATTAAVVFLAAWAAVGALGKGAQTTSAVSSSPAASAETEQDTSGDATAEAPPDVVTSQS
jgi:hypothetical protein